ncbi:MAG: DNA primase DnaG [Candidatus Pacearchaeota archaeon]
MGKVSPPSIKYIIKARFTAEGVVEKPDVIGAIFGQTEGLLGEELELRELQKKGKIGRIEANLEVKDSRTQGIVEIPTSIDKTETALIAAAIETIDRIGPCDAKFEILSIEDVRMSKRQYIVERAKALFEKLTASLPEIKEIENEIASYAKTSKISEFGPERLPCGPDMENPEIIVVEGRADVLNLLKAGIKNVIAMNGTVVPKTIKELGKTKKLILFVDGDRGGLLIAKDAIQHAQVAKIARAPDGKEVEELTEKEINVCLRNALSVEDFKKNYFKRRERKTQQEEKASEHELVGVSKEHTAMPSINFEQIVKKVEGTKACIIVFDSSGKKLVKKSMNELTKFLHRLRENRQKIYALVIDGTLTKGILNLAEQLSCQYIAARNFQATSEKIKFLSF